MKTRNTVINTWWFLSALGILLLNDFFLKSFFGNWMTGKLSDFAGLFIFPLFWSVLFPRLRNTIFWVSGLFFIFWKSSYSQGMIDAWNSNGLFTIHRVVDYTDLSALIVLPLAHYLERKKTITRFIRISPVFPLCVSAFAIMATSKGPQTCFFDDPSVYHIKHLSRDSFVNDLKSSGLDINIAVYQPQEEEVHAEINNLNDSIKNLVLKIRGFRDSDSTIEVVLGCWTYGNRVGLENAGKQELENHRHYVRTAFEQEVLRKINKK